MDDFRYDLVWRRIRRDEYSKKFEGSFPYQVERLAHLVNWGALSWLHPHATATKQAHHFGVEHNAMRFLDADQERHHHRASLRTAAHILHWGHPPLSYQSAEALIRAAHVKPEIHDTLKEVVNAVIAFGALDCGDSEHERPCADTMLEGERPFELYRWLAAWIASEEWARVWDAIVDAESALGNPAPDEEKTKRSLVRTLVCHEHRGFQILHGCNEADYVPRDLLQCGTAWLSLDPDVLWDTDPLGPHAADEWALIESSRQYLEQRFYSTPEALLLHTLTARVLANSFASLTFSLDTLRKLLRSPHGDAYYDKELTPHYRDTYDTLKASAQNQLDTDWWHVGTFDYVSVPSGTRLSAEDFFSDRTGRNRLSFPFTEGHSLYCERSNAPTRNFPGKDRQYVTVHCHHHRAGPESKARPLLNSLAAIENWSRRRLAPEVGDAILSWLLYERVTQQTADISTLLSEIVAAKPERFSSAIAQLRERSSYVEFNGHGDNTFVADLITDTDFGLAMAGGEFVLRLPWRGMRLAAGKTLLEYIRSESLSRVSSSGGGRGTALELAVAADQLLIDNGCSHRFLMLNATQWRADRTPEREWDVIRVDLLGDGTWSVKAIECAINRSSKKDEESQTRLAILQRALRGSYADFALYETDFATIVDGDLRYEDAGRSFRANT